MVLSRVGSFLCSIIHQRKHLDGQRAGEAGAPRDLGGLSALSIAKRARKSGGGRVGVKVLWEEEQLSQALAKSFPSRSRACRLKSLP